MVTCVSTINAMIAVGVYQLTKILVSLYQRLRILCRITEVHIIICHSMTKQ